MSKFTRERKKRRLEKQRRIDNLNETREHLERFTEQVTKLYKDHPDFDFNNLLEPKNLEIWKKYVQEYHDTLTEEFA